MILLVVILFIIQGVQGWQQQLHSTTTTTFPPCHRSSSSCCRNNIRQHHFHQLLQVLWQSSSKLYSLSSDDEHSPNILLPITRTTATTTTPPVSLVASHTRRHVLTSWIPTTSTIVPAFLVLATTTTTTTQPSDVAHALIKGNAPPPKKSASSYTEKPKCTNIDECQALGEQREEQLLEQQAERDAKTLSSSSSSSPILTTPKGVRYRDMPSSSNAAQQKNNANLVVVVKPGDQVKLAYRVLKLGKRSYDGLSGEGTVIFSRGYGLDDDEQRPGDTYWITTVGQVNNIVALNEALIGMTVGGNNNIRRFTIVPQYGWERPTPSCDGGPGGRGPGGDVKVDYVVVPTATMVATEACLDMTKQPFPTTYAQQRRMAQRFDQTLLMEVQVLDIINESSSSQQQDTIE